MKSVLQSTLFAYLLKGATEHIAGNIGVDALIPRLLCICVAIVQPFVFHHRAALIRPRAQIQLGWQTSACIHVDFALAHCGAAEHASSMCALWCCRARIVHVRCGAEFSTNLCSRSLATKTRIVFEYPSIPFVVMLLVRVLTCSRCSGCV